VRSSRDTNTPAANSSPSPPRGSPGKPRRVSTGSAPRTRIATPFQLFCPCQIAPDQVERWPIDQLIPYAKNSRTHSEAQIAQLAASMKEWGWTNPVLADEAGGVIAGHARILAARQLGIAEVPVMVARARSDAQKRAYVIADNQVALNPNLSTCH